MKIASSSPSTSSSLPVLSAVKAHLAASKATKEELSTAVVRGRLVQDVGYALLARLADA